MASLEKSPKDSGVRTSEFPEIPRSELPIPVQDIVQSMEWMTIERPELLSAESIALHNNMEVIARLLNALLRAFKSTRARSACPSSLESTNAEEKDLELELEMEDISVEQSFLRAQMNVVRRNIERIHAFWIEYGHVPYTTRNEKLLSDAQAFFYKLATGYDHQDFENLDEHPDSNLITSLSNKSMMILYISYNKKYKKTPAK